ncbi:TPA: hypothetical protein ACSCYS_004516 [Aeromonas veronii]|nr:hypothetical protein [Aeromonas veronii]
MSDAVEKILQLINEHTGKINSAIADESKPSIRRNQEMTFSTGFLHGLIAALDAEELLAIPEEARSSLRNEAVKSTHIIGEWTETHRKLQANEALILSATPSLTSKMH